PHMLIAGTTGSGKSVCMNTIIMSFLYTRKPNELKLVLVDPKMVEMSQFKDIPHLMCPVVTEMTKAAAILEWACKKMDERYELLAEAGCRDIASYNKLEWEEIKERLAGPGETLSEEEAARIPKKLPYMVFVIDELADLMMTAKEVEGSIIRIAQKARAVGIHLILATQRPQANVVTGLIKSNMPCRVCFKVSSNIDSRVIMDQKGGELLLGQGDMLFLSPRTHKLQRAQGTLVDDHEIRRVVKFLKDIATPSFERQLIQLRATADEERLFESENHSSASLAAAQEDPLFDRAVEIVAETQRGSVSLLQRRLGIGYTRASRLIDLMGLAGLIGEHKGSVARAVMVTPEQWAQVKEFAEQETGASFPSAAGVETPEDDADRQMAFDELTAGPVADSAEEPPFVVNDAPSEPASDKPVSEDLGPDNEPGDEPNNPPDPDADQGPEGRAPSEPIADADADVEIEAKPDETLTDDDLAESIEGDPSDDADEEGEDEEWDETGEYVDEGEEDEEDEEEESDDAEAAADDEGEDEEGEEEEEEEEEGEYEYEYEYEYVDEEEDADAEEDDGDDSGEEEDGEESDDAVSEADEPDRAKITVKSSSDATVEDPTEAAPGRAG
ncbi:MAG: DNA translocase FtsK, partial [Planctomycetota bacterium]